MSLDRLLTLYLFRPLITLRNNADSARALPILMYHSLSDDPEADKANYFKVCTHPERFSQHMDFLHQNGFQGVTLQEGLERLDSSEGSSKQAVAITFDDGFRDFYTEAYPVLQKHRFSATMYLPTAYIGDTTKSFKGKECLNWNEVHELDNAGIEFGSHTVNHPKLVELSKTEIHTELSESKQRIENELGKPTHSFAYPYAYPQQDTEFSRHFTSVLEQCGYDNCVTTAIGTARHSHNRFQLKRLPANSADDKPLLAAKLTGAYNWLATFQRLKKLIRNR